MDVYLIVGTRSRWTKAFREGVTFYQQGLSHGKKFVPWSCLKRVTVINFVSNDMPRDAWKPRFLGTPAMVVIKWAVMTVETTNWKVVFDSRTAISPEETNLDDVDEFSRITDSFKRAKDYLESYHPEKIIYKKPFCGFYFGAWDTWLVLILIAPIIFGVVWVIVHSLFLFFF